MAWANMALIGLNVLSYILTDWVGERMHVSIFEELKERMILDPRHLELSSFISYQFIHGDFWHLFGNMLFLWVFGNGVNDKMGNIPYLLFYLAGGIFGGVGFVTMDNNPCLGASGAIAAVTTAFLVLYPRAYVTVFYWLWFYVGTMQVQALLLIGLKIILWDNILAPSLTHGEGDMVQVAYSAHVAGYLFGFVVASLMLVFRALPRDQYDIIALAKRYYQRQQFRAAMATPEARARATYGRVARPINDVSIASDPPPGPGWELRGEIADLLSRREYTAAAHKYEQLMIEYPETGLPRKQLLEVANQLMALQRYPQAAGAYERFVKSYPADGEVDQVKLILGIIYAKYLQQSESATRYLRDCLQRLTNPDQVAQASHWLHQMDQHPAT